MSYRISYSGALTLDREPSRKHERYFNEKFPNTCWGLNFDRDDKCQLTIEYNVCADVAVKQLNEICEFFMAEGGYLVNGEIRWSGEDPDGDIGVIRVHNGHVSTIEFSLQSAETLVSELEKLVGKINMPVRVEVQNLLNKYVKNYSDKGVQG